MCDEAASPKMFAWSGSDQKLDAGAGAALRAIISRAIRSKRHEIAAQLTTQSGRAITVSMLNDWSALTKPRTRFPADLVALFCEITGEDQLQRAILSPRLLALLELGEFVERLLDQHVLEIRKKAPR
jgi:hypothetical protein